MSAIAKADEEFLEILDKNYLPGQMFNMYKTSLIWKQMPERTFIHKESKPMAGFETFKDRLTVSHGGNVGIPLKAGTVRTPRSSSTLMNTYRQ